MWNTNVNVVKVGTCTVDPGKVTSTTHSTLLQQLGIGGGSTVTLIKEGAEIILVDTGYDNELDLSPRNKENNWVHLTSCLSLHNIKPEEVTRVFITHFHRDHFGNIERFDRARWYCHSVAAQSLQESMKERFTLLEEGDELVRNTKMICTPGHTLDHSSVLWTSQEQSVRIVVAGDAIINLAWLQANRVWQLNSDFSGVNEAKESTEKVLDAGDIIIPGHGQPFFSSQVTKKERTVNVRG